ncbi:MAG: dihydropteroate synthase [Planctomycetales bacterium]|nr:dihydropteroate synthase [Planctomycetales bacterium]
MAEGFVLRLRGREVPLGPRPWVQGILNVTPDSFSDGGRFLDPAAAVARGRAMAEEGADLLDVGGESTRPGSAPVPEAEERARVIPVIRALARDVAVPISVDTSKASVAAAALEAGAAMVNDVTALRGDPAMAGVLARAGGALVLMHMQGEPRTMQAAPRYGEVVAEVAAFLRERVEAAVAAGIAREQLLVDPGIGFGKTLEHNLEILRRLGELRSIGRPILVGPSRKSFLGALLDLPVGERLEGTLAAVAACVLRGALVVRVHDVRAAARAVRVAAALRSDGVL